MSARFFLAAAPRSGRAVLEGDEARHLARVLRARIGDEVRVFDGCGHEWLGRVAALGRDTVELAVGDPLPAPTMPVLPPLTLAVALPKGERQRWLVEKLTELGVDRLVPLVTARGVAAVTPAVLERLRRGAIEACKQCGRNTLPEISQPATVAGACASLPVGGRVILCDPGAPPLDAATLRAGGAALALVGPEGGFTAEEIAEAEAAGAVRAGLGPHVLRVETAALALAARVLS